MLRCSFFPFIPLSWENLPELIHPSQRMNFQSGISRIFQCGSSFVNLASVAYVAGKGNVNRIWSLGQCGLPHLFQRKSSKKEKKIQGYLAQAMSMVEQRSGVASTWQTTKKVLVQAGSILPLCTLVFLARTNWKTQHGGETWTVRMAITDQD